jgi:hypothetical protein
VNPLNKHHGLKNPAGPHAGDLPDMYVQKNGVGHYEVLADSVTLDAAATSLFDTDGTALIIHARSRTCGLRIMCRDFPQAVYVVLISRSSALALGFEDVSQVLMCYSP